MKNYSFSKSTWLLIIAFLIYPALQAQVYNGTLRLTTQAQVDAFNYTAVSRSLEISGSDITDLSPLSNLTYVGHRLDIINNISLTNLDGLSSLAFVWNLTLDKNAVLSNVDGLSSLATVRGDLRIYNNDALTNLDGLSSLTFVGIDMLIYQNNLLTNVDGLSSIPSVAGALWVYGNISLTNVDGLSSIAYAGSLYICQNDLTNLDGLSSLNSVISWVYIIYNTLLANVDGLSSLTSVGGYLSVQANPLLSEFCGLNPLLEGCGLSGGYYVWGNAENPTPQQIIEGGPCNTPPIAICQDVSVLADENCQTIVTAAEIDNGSYDPDGDVLTLSLSPEGPFSLGDTEVILTVSDGQESSTCTATITVVDETEPVLTAISNPISLWPPNHKYKTIYLSQLFVSISDNCADLSMDDVYISSVSSDEPEDAKGGGDGKTLNDIVIDYDCQSVDLRKERSGNGNGRVYTIYLAVEDGNGNTGTASCQVQVPHNKGGIAIDDGMAYEVDCGSKSSFTAFTEDEIQLMNYPNPFNGNTTISFTLTETGYTTLKVYDTFGKEVAILFAGFAKAGQEYILQFNGEGLKSDIYIYHLKSGNNVSVVKKMIQIK